MKVDAAALTDAGPFKHRNEDVVLAQDGLYLVADGMGGRPLGERAAAVSAALFPALCTGTPRPEVMLSAFQAVNDALIAESRARGLSEAMAAVATVAWVAPDGRLLLGHVGDTRALLFDEDGAGCQLTRDQSAVDADAIPEAESLASPGRNLVAAALGLEPWGVGGARERVEVRAAKLREGQTLVLLSDGVSDYLDRARLAEVVLEHAGSARRLAQALIARAVEAQRTAGRGDNLGVVVARRPKIASRKPLRIDVAAALLVGVLIGASAQPAWQALHAVPDASAAQARQQGPVSLGGTWEDAAMWGGAPWVLAPSAPMKVARGRAVTISGVDASGSSPLVIELEAGARLTLSDVRLVLHGSSLRLLLGPGATLELVRTRLDVQRLEVDVGRGAVVHTYASQATVHEGPNPFDPTPGGPSS